MLILAKIVVTMTCLLVLYAMTGVSVRVDNRSSVQKTLAIALPASLAIVIVWVRRLRVVLMRGSPGSVTHEELLYWTSYDYATGLMTWRRSKPRIQVGREVGWLNYKGYRCAVVCGEGWLVHRLIWFWGTGKHLPDDMLLDH